MMLKSTELKVRLDPAVKREIGDLASLLGMSKSQVVREGIYALKRESEKRAALENLKKSTHEDQRLLRKECQRDGRLDPKKGNQPTESS